MRSGLVLGNLGPYVHHFSVQCAWLRCFKSTRVQCLMNVKALELLICTPQVPEAGKAPKRARLALKPKAAKARAAGKPAAAPPTSVKRPQCDSASDNECGPNARCMGSAVLLSCCSQGSFNSQVACTPRHTVMQARGMQAS